MVSKKLEQDFKDFTEKHYKKILENAKTYYKFSFYNDVLKDRHIILRHDVDFSIHRALKIAEIERDYRIKSTYFLRLHSEFYNLFEDVIYDKIKEIIKLRHQIGLHFETPFYNIKNIKQLREKLLHDKKILEGEFNQKIKVFAFHTPEMNNMLRFKDGKIATMINVYGGKFASDYKYCSDSDGYWRHDRIYDVIKSRKYDRLHILTHPEWWHTKPMSPMKRLEHMVQSRAGNQMRMYENQLKKHNRRIIW